jgi:membrane associated rhomboid family serine protease
MLKKKISSIVIGIFLILIYLGYNIGYLVKIPCENTITSKFLSNFVHIDSIHLLLNLLGLFIISNFEKEIGTKKFVILVSSLTIVLTIIDKIFLKKCSIGFSGVLYGIFAYQMMYEKNVDYQMLIVLVLMFLFSTDTKISHTSHIFGFFSGLALSLCL